MPICQVCQVDKPDLECYPYNYKLSRGYWVPKCGLPLCYACKHSQSTKSPNQQLDTKFEKSLSETDKAYIAGLIDGEGCIGIAKKKKKYSFDVRLTISNTSSELVGWIVGKIGGLVYIAKWKYINSEKEILSGRNPLLWKDRKAIVFTNQRARAILFSVKKYMVIKRNQADLALEYFNHTVKQGTKIDDNLKAKRIALYERMKVLNKRGKSI